MAVPARRRPRITSRGHRNPTRAVHVRSLAAAYKRRRYCARSAGTANVLPVASSIREPSNLLRGTLGNPVDFSGVTMAVSSGNICRSKPNHELTRMRTGVLSNGPIALVSSLILLGLPWVCDAATTLVRTSGGSVRFHEPGFRNRRGDRNVARPRIESRIVGRRRRRPHVAQRSRPRTSAASETHRPFNIPPSQTESVVRFSVG